MADFAFKALDEAGREVSGRQTAASEGEALQALAARGLSPTEIRRAQQRAALFRRKLGKADVNRALRQLATLLQSGIELLEAMNSLARGGHPELAARATAAKRDLRAGGKLSEALAKHFPELPPYVPRLTELGEATGQTGKTLTDAADRLEREERQARELRSALTYPAFLAIVGGVITIFMFIFVIPRFATLIDQSQGDIPAMSRWVIGAGVWSQANWPYALAAVVIAGVAVAASRRRLGAALYAAAERAPLTGRLLTRSEMAGWARTMGVALANGAGLLDALSLAERGVKSQRLAAHFPEVRRKVRSGKPLDIALSEAIHDIDPVLIDMVRTGRSSGNLGPMLLFAADMYEDEARELRRRVTGLAEPAAVLFISVIVGAIVLSIVVAMTSLYDFDL